MRSARKCVLEVSKPGLQTDSLGLMLLSSVIWNYLISHTHTHTHTNAHRETEKNKAEMHAELKYPLSTNGCRRQPEHNLHADLELYM